MLAEGNGTFTRPDTRRSQETYPTLQPLPLVLSLNFSKQPNLS